MSTETAKKASPREFLDSLRAANKEFYDSDRGRGALSLLQQTFTEPWLYVAELIQNAIDAHAKKIRFAIGEGTLTFEHDGEEFVEGDVRGLCSQALSTKGFRTVGFMGIGFKSVFHAFARARVASGPWRFSLEVPVREGPFGALLTDWLGTVLPQWDDEPNELSPGMRCRFVLEDRRIGLGKVADDLMRVFDERCALLALMSLRGVQEVAWTESWTLQCSEIDQKTFKILGTRTNQSGPEENRSWILFRSPYVPADPALRRLVEHRRQAVLHGDPNEARQERFVSLFLEMDAGTSPRPPTSGRGFALLPTGLQLPIRAHVDADWLLSLTRREPMHLENDPWHEEIVELIPGLVRDYLSWVSSANLSREALKTALEVLPAFREETGGPSAFIQRRLREKLAKLIAPISFLPSVGVKGTLSPAQARFLPNALSELDDPTFRPARLLGKSIASQRMLGERAQRCLRDLALRNELQPEELASEWKGGRVSDWLSGFPAEDRDKRLLGLLIALGGLTETAWNSVELLCLPTEGGKWVSRPGAIRAPAEWSSVPDDVRPELSPYVGPQDSVVRWEIDRALTQQLARHYLLGLAPVRLEDVLNQWWTDVQKSPDTWVDAVLRVTRWIRTKLPNRSDLVRKAICIASSGSATLENTEDALLAEPFAGSWRRTFFPDVLAVASLYMSDGTSVADWRQFFESLEREPKGRFAMYYEATVLDRDATAKRIQESVIPKPATSRYRVQWRNTVLVTGQYGWVDFSLPPPFSGLLERDLSPHESRSMWQWVTEGASSLSEYATCHIASVTRSQTVAEVALIEPEAEWVRTVKASRCVYARSGAGPFCPADVLAAADLARPDAPVADLPSELLSTLEACGVAFGTSIQDAPAIERLRAEGSTATPSRLLEQLAAAIQEADTPAKRRHLENVIDGTPLVPVPAGHISPDGTSRVSRTRLVHRVGASSELAGWVIAAESFEAESPERRLIELLDQISSLPTATTGRQALDFLSWVWNSTPEADRIRRALPIAYDYVRSRSPEDTELARAWESARQGARVFTNRRRWVACSSTDLYFDDFPRGIRNSLLPTTEVATSGHLGEGHDQQLATANFLGLKTLSSSYRLGTELVGPLDAPVQWVDGLSAVWRFLLEVRASADDDAESAPLLLPIDRYTEITQAIHELASGTSICERRVYVTTEAERLRIAGEPRDFAVDLCEYLLESLAWPIERRLSLQVCALLAFLDHPGELAARLATLTREYNLQPSVPTQTGATLPAEATPPSGHSGNPAGDPPAPAGTPVPTSGASAPPTSHGDRSGSSYTARRRESELAAHLRAIQKLRALGLEVGEASNEAAGEQPTGEALEAPYRLAALAFEKNAGRFPVAKDRLQPGHDIDSFSHDEGEEARTLVRRIEVKGHGTQWSGEEVVELSRRQFTDASARSSEPPIASDFDYWLYVVERVAPDQYCVLPIRNPSARAKLFEVRAGTWRSFAEEGARIVLSGTREDEE